MLAPRDGRPLRVLGVEPNGRISVVCMGEYGVPVLSNFSPTAEDFVARDWCVTRMKEAKRRLGVARTPRTADAPDVTPPSDKQEKTLVEALTALHAMPKDTRCCFGVVQRGDEDSADAFPGIVALRQDLSLVQLHSRGGQFDVTPFVGFWNMLNSSGWVLQPLSEPQRQSLRKWNITQAVQNPIPAAMKIESSGESALMKVLEHVKAPAALRSWAREKRYTCVEDLWTRGDNGKHMLWLAWQADSGNPRTLHRWKLVAAMWDMLHFRMMHLEDVITTAENLTSRIRMPHVAWDAMTEITSYLSRGGMLADATLGQVATRSRLIRQLARLKFSGGHAEEWTRVALKFGVLLRLRLVLAAIDWKVGEGALKCEDLAEDGGGSVGLPGRWAQSCALILRKWFTRCPFIDDLEDED